MVLKNIRISLYKPAVCSLSVIVELGFRLVQFTFCTGGSGPARRTVTLKA